ncbi:MAG: HIT family protein [Phycisphaerae bacterium]|nr:HIT family protein [Phycisphaerae bacterium]
MPRDADCIFCRIVSAEVSASVVYEDENCLAFLDVAPLAEGHLLLVPRDHFSDLTSLPPPLCGSVMSLLPRLGSAVMTVAKASGFNVLVNNGKAAGQAVPHVHIHVIPRVASDGLGYRWNASKYAPGRAEVLAEAYQRALRTPS